MASPQPRRTGSADPDAVATVADLLVRAGCVAAEEEAAELAVRAGGDSSLLMALAERRRAGEPLAWITGRIDFGDLTVRVDEGVYVPRWQSVELARRAAAQLPDGGTAIDLCTGTGAVAAALTVARPSARVVATDRDPRAVACARANGVEAYCGDLFTPVPPALHGATDAVVAVAPYVPTPALRLLPHDTLHFEDASHYDGGPDGTGVLRRIVEGAPRYLRAGGALLLELGGEQADLLGPHLERQGYGSVETWSDEDGDLRGLQATLG